MYAGMLSGDDVPVFILWRLFQTVVFFPMIMVQFW